MPLNAALLFLLQNLGHGKRSVIVRFQQMLTWENPVLPILLEEKLLVEAELAKSLPCKCGEKDCLMSVVSSDLSAEVTGKIVGAVFFGICGKSHSFIGILTEFEQCYLKQWQLTHQMLIDWLTNYLRLEPPKEANSAGVLQVGILTLNGETYALALGMAGELVLLVNGDAVPITDIFRVSEGGAIEANTSLIENARGNRKRVTPKRLHKAKRDAQIFEKYLEIKAQFPNLKSDNAVIPQIMKDKDLAEDLAPESIRRILSNQKKLSK